MLVLALNLLILPWAALAAGSTPTINDEPTRTLAVRQSHPETTIPCKIINANGAVNCHEGPYLNSPVVRELYAGDYYEFNCYDLGDCYDDNCTWDHAYNENCFVNGYFTDSSCSVANLGPGTC